MAKEVVIVLQGGTPKCSVDSLTTADAVNYGTVNSVTITSGLKGCLFEISLVTTSYALTHWRVTIGDSVEVPTDTIIPISLTFPWYTGNELEAGTVILVEAKSVDGTTITATASITYKEI